MGVKGELISPCPVYAPALGILRGWQGWGGGALRHYPALSGFNGLQ